MQQPVKVYMKSPEGEVKEVVVNDPGKDLVPLMVQGYHQVFIDEKVMDHQEK